MSAARRLDTSSQRKQPKAANGEVHGHTGACHPGNRAGGLTVVAACVWNGPKPGPGTHRRTPLKSHLLRHRGRPRECTARFRVEAITVIPCTVQLLSLRLALLPVPCARTPTVAAASFTAVAIVATPTGGTIAAGPIAFPAAPHVTLLPGEGRTRALRDSGRHEAAAAGPAKAEHAQSSTMAVLRGCRLHPLPNPLSHYLGG